MHALCYNTLTVISHKSAVIINIMHALCYNTLTVISHKSAVITVMHVEHIIIIFYTLCNKANAIF